MSQTDIIDNVLGVTDIVENVTKDVSPPKPVLVPETKMNEEDVDNDYKYQRENFYNLIERGQDAIDGILDLARESEHPRSYEVAGNLIKQVAEVTEKLGDLQGKMKKLKEKDLILIPFLKAKKLLALAMVLMLTFYLNQLPQ